MSRQSIARKLKLALVTAVVVAAAGAAFLFYDLRHFRTKAEEDLSSVAGQVGERAAAAVAERQSVDDTDLGLVLQHQKDVVVGYLYDGSRRVLAGYQRPNQPSTADRLFLERHFDLGGGRVGTMHLEADLSRVHEIVKTDLRIAFAVLLLACATAFFLGGGTADQKSANLYTRYFTNASIKRKLVLAMMLSSSIAAAFGCGAFLIDDLQKVRKKAKQDLASALDVLAPRMALGVAFTDAEAVDDQLKSLKRRPDVVAAYVIDRAVRNPPVYGIAKNDPVFFAWGENLAKQPPVSSRVIINHPLFVDKQEVGLLQVHGYFGTTPLDVRGAVLIAVVILLASLVIAYLLSAGLQRIITSPVLELVEAERIVAETQDYTIQVRKKSEDEIGRLIDGFHAMLEEIRLRDAQLLSAKERAEDANALKTFFLDNMSDELREPLDKIIGLTELLIEDYEDEPALSTDLHNIDVSAKHLLGLIDDLLELARIEAGKTKPSDDPVDLPLLLDEIQKSLGKEIDGKGNRLTVTIADDVRTVSTDERMLRQILFNLMSNANRFTERGRITVDVSAESGTHRLAIHFRVEDTGVGISPEQKARIFKPLSHAESPDRRRQRGPGLGLEISQRFAQLLGSGISVESELGKGSVFTFVLPQEPAVRKRVLLMVGDESAARERVRRAAAREGYEFIDIAAGDDALQMARQLRPDLIALDVPLPGMAGWTVLTALKADPELATIPVVLMTIPGDKDGGLALGAADFVVKPFEREQLVRLLRKFENASPPTLLLVDHDRETRQLVRSMLEHDRWTVTEVDRGPAALDWLRNNRPSVVLADLMMPEMDGFTFIDALRAERGLNEIPVVMLTTRELTNDDRIRLRGGVDRILERNAGNHEELESTLRSVLVRYASFPAAEVTGHA